MCTNTYEYVQKLKKTLMKDTGLTTSDTPFLNIHINLFLNFAPLTSPVFHDVEEIFSVVKKTHLIFTYT